MYEWLDSELALIKTPRFHIVDGPIQPNDLLNGLPTFIGIPPSYRYFVERFGAAKLYRNARNNSYRVGVFARPMRFVSIRKEDGLQLGFNDGAIVYIKYNTSYCDYTIYEYESDKESRVAENFEEWLTTSCVNARKCFTKKAWEAVVNGPMPFSEEELQIVAARRQFVWKVVGLDQNGKHLISIHNQSNRILPVLTVGVRSKDQRLNGAIRLSTANLKPGESVIVHAECYRDLVQPQEIELFSLPDPQPEDRERYREFNL